MNRKSLVVLLVSLVLYPLVSSAQAPGIFVAVTGSEEAIVRAGNEYYLKKQLYYAKRHRIVRVDTDFLLLDDKEPTEFAFNLFDDYAPVYSVTRRTIQPHDLGFSLVAVRENPPMFAQDWVAANSGMSLDSAQSIIDDIFTLSLSGTLHVRDDARNRSWPAHVFYTPAFGRPAHLSKPKSLDPASSTFFAVRTNLLDPISGARYELKPIISDRRYHAVWEVDSEKTFATPDHSADEIPWSSEEQRRQNDARRLAYEEFLLSLGDDPREATLQRDQDAFRQSLKDKSSDTGLMMEGVQ